MKVMRAKWWAVFLAALLCMGGLSGMVFGEEENPAPKVVLRSSVSDVQVGKTFEVTVAYSGVLNGFDMNLGYDTECLDVEEYTFGCQEASGAFNPKASNDGRAYFNVSNGMVNLTAEDSTLVTITFKAKKAGTVHFDLKVESMFYNDDTSNHKPCKINAEVDNQVSEGIEIWENTYVKGDINKDTFVNAIDALQVLRHSVKDLVLKKDDFYRADVNDDGEVDSGDALSILKTSVDL